MSFVQVQNELKELRKSLSQNESKIDLKILQSALQKTENEIKVFSKMLDFVYLHELIFD